VDVRRKLAVIVCRGG